MIAPPLAYTVATPEVATKRMLAWTGAFAEIVHELRSIGYAGLELMMRDPGALDMQALLRAIEDEGLRVPALGLGPAAQEDRLTLTDPDPSVRRASRGRLERFILIAAQVGAQVNLGRMRGRLLDGTRREESYNWAVDEIRNAASLAADRGVTILIEPQARAAINFVNTLQEAVDLIADIGVPNVKVLADAYYMHTEENAPVPALITAWPHVAHVHLAENHRQALGWGALPWPMVVEVALALGYTGFFTIEIQQEPSPLAAARQSYQRFTEAFEDAHAKSSAESPRTMLGT